MLGLGRIAIGERGMGFGGCGQESDLAPFIHRISARLAKAALIRNSPAQLESTSNWF